MTLPSYSLPLMTPLAMILVDVQDVFDFIQSDPSLDDRQPSQTTYILVRTGRTRMNFRIGLA